MGSDPLEQRIGYDFRDAELRSQAFTHRSHRFENEGGLSLDNERLEFLGDAILGFLVSRLLYQRFPSLREGELSRLRSQLVSARSLARRARLLDLGAELRLGRGEEKSGGRDKDSILADAYESLLGAIFIDGGLDAARIFLERELEAELDLQDGRSPHRDFKSQLQEVLHARGEPEPSYQVIEETGPDHSKTFEVAVVAAEGEIGRGRGRSKKAAQQQAALAALLHFGLEPGNLDLGAG